MSRSHRSVWTTLLGVVALVVALLPASVGVQPASAANASEWDPGLIISDSLFYDTNSMTASDIQAFLNSKVRTCRAGAMPCLKDYVQSTDNRPADRYCNGYTGRPRESAAQIIDNVARSCGIGQKVLLVLLEKEQSLVTATSPEAWAYAAATGQGCPDTAPCDPSTSGFFYQVYYAARQYEIYRLTSTQWGYQAGRWNNILYSTDRACGTKRVYIQNQATAALYIYTPYTPNQASLDNLYGTGDACSTYGNRNFWRLYTDWFGSTRIDVRGRIATTYAGFGGSNGWLGSAVGDYVCELADGGCYRQYARGRIYASELTAGVSVSPSIQGVWDANGAESGAFGYPQSEAFAAPGGWMQSFRNGIAVLPDGREAQFVAGAIGLAWFNGGAMSSALGAPVSPQYCVLTSNGCVQVYVGGWYYWSPDSGAHYVNGPVVRAWSDRGSETGTLGYPLSDSARDPVGSGDWARFQGGVLYVDGRGTPWVVGGDSASAYVGAVNNGTGLGAPLGESVCGAGVCTRRFTAGAIVKADGADAQYVAGQIGRAWLDAGGVDSPAGVPTSQMYCGLSRGGCLQVYTRGWYYWSPGSGAYLVPNALLNAWSESGSERGAIGYPLRTPTPLSGGSVQSFQGGVGVVSDAGAAQFVAGPIGVAWLSAGAFTSPAGVPTSRMYCGLSQGGCLQVYAGGWYYWSPGSGAYLVPNALLNAWSAAGSERGWVGYPLGDPVAVRGGSLQSFQGGVGVVSDSGATQFVAGPIGVAWLNAGAFTSPAGVPTAPMQCDATSTFCSQTFSGGQYFWSQSGGARFQTR